jgi:hypothetical protein
MVVPPRWGARVGYRQYYDPQFPKGAAGLFLLYFLAEICNTITLVVKFELTDGRVSEVLTFSSFGRSTKCQHIEIGGVLVMILTWVAPRKLNHLKC